MEFDGIGCGRDGQRRRSRRLKRPREVRFLRAAAANAIAARSRVAGNEGDGGRGPRRQGQLGFSFILRKILRLLPLLF